MSYDIAIVGAGPTAIYSFQALLDCSPLPLSITLFERQRRAGQGTPYSAHWSDPIMLSNIASLEIPALPERLVDWLQGLPDQRLQPWGILRDAIDERAFYPRLVLGEYLSAQFDILVRWARDLGVRVDVCTRTRVTDVQIAGEKITITAASPRGETERLFDYVILATGHQWPADPEVRPGYFTSPWPAEALSRIRNCRVGIRGTALSAIDAAVVLADNHGNFVEDDDRVVYTPDPGTDDFHVNMFSRKGLLPEADFFYPLPYEPLAICTADAIERLVSEADSDSLLEAAFELFRAELAQADSEYASAVHLRNATLEEFCGSYFEARCQVDPFEWAERNLAEAVANHDRKFTVPWRYAILRMHEVFGALASHLNDAEFARFNHTLKPVFVDNYATVPHESIRRLLALHAAGKLSVSQLAEGARLDSGSAGHGATLISGATRLHFPAFIEATGQKVSSAKDFPFPSLRRQGAIQDVSVEGEHAPKRGIAIDGDYHPISTMQDSHRLFCLSLPFLLGQHPFAQGITSSAEMADVVVKAIEDRETPPAARSAASCAIA